MSLLDDVSIVVTPNGYKAGELYAVVPVPTEGAEQVVNGDFATDTDWTIGGTTFSAGAILLDDANDNVFQGWTDTVNTLYKLTITKTGLGTLRFRSGFAGSAATKIEIPESGIIYFTSTSDTNRIQIYGDENSINATLNSVSVKEYTSADMDVTRATAATRVDENGLVNYAEIVTGSDIVTDGDFPDGSTAWALNGWTISGNTANGNGLTANMIQTISGSTNKTYSLTFTISNYVSGSVTPAFVGFKDDSLNYSSNGTFTEVISSASDTRFVFYGASFNGSIDNVSVKEVTRDNVPRIDYTGGGCPHILAEPQRTNLLTYSENFSTSAGWGATGAVVTPNQAISPDGTLNATLVELDTNADRLADVLSSTGGTYTFSFYVKAKEGESGNWASRVVGDSSLFTTTFVDDSAWVRVSKTFTKTGSGNIIPYPAYRLDGTSTLFNAYIWGAQIEEGSYATSYIPTSGSTVTRNQDIFTRDGIGSLINSTEGVLFLEASTLSDGSGGAVSVSDGTPSNYIYLYFHPSGTKIVAKIVVGGITKMDKNILAIDETLNNKFAFKYNATEFAVWVNGSEVTTEVGFAFPSDTLNRLGFDNGAGSTPFYGKVKQLQVYDTALTDEQLLQLTGESGTDFYESYAEMASALTYTIQ